MNGWEQGPIKRQAHKKKGIWLCSKSPACWRVTSWRKVSRLRHPTLADRGSSRNGGKPGAAASAGGSCRTRTTGERRWHRGHGGGRGGPCSVFSSVEDPFYISLLQPTGISTKAVGARQKLCASRKQLLVYDSSTLLSGSRSLSSAAQRGSISSSLPASLPVPPSVSSASSSRASAS